MNKFRSLFAIVFFLLAIILTGCGGGNEATTGETDESNGEENIENDAKEEHELKMSVTTGESSTWFLAAEKFADEIEENTDGRITLSVHANEQLSGGDSGKAVELLSKGSIDFTYNSTIIYSILDDRFGVLSAPFLFKDLEEVDKAMVGEGAEMVNDILREKGVEPLGFGENGFRQVTNSVHPIKSPADIEDLKIRIPGIKMYTDLWSELGADPSTMTFSEVFTALQQGTIDGQENPIDVIHSSKLNEVQQYITMWNYSYDPLVLGVNKELFDSLHPDDQEVIRTAAENANKFQIEEARKKEEEQIAELKESGMEFYTPTDEELAKFKEAVQPVYDEFESIWGKELLDAFQMD